MAVTVSAEGRGFAVFQVCNMVMSSKNMLSKKKVYWKLDKTVNKNNLLKYLKPMPRYFTT